MLGLPDRRRLELDGRGIPTGREEPVSAEWGPLGDSVQDDHYALGADRHFRLGALELVFGEGYPFAQVFAPAESTFVAIEPMTARVNALVEGTAPRVEPGGRFAAVFTIS